MRGQHSVEYALIVATVALLVLIGGGALGQIIYRWLDGVIGQATRWP